MLLKPLVLFVAIDFGLLSIALTLRFIIYPLWQFWHRKKLACQQVKEMEKTIEIRIEEIPSSDHHKQYLKV